MDTSPTVVVTEQKWTRLPVHLRPEIILLRCTEGNRERKRAIRRVDEVPEYLIHTCPSSYYPAASLTLPVVVGASSMNSGTSSCMKLGSAPSAAPNSRSSSTS